MLKSCCTLCLAPHPKFACSEFRPLPAKRGEVRDDHNPRSISVNRYRFPVGSIITRAKSHCIIGAIISSDPPAARTWLNGRSRETRLISLHSVAPDMTAEIKAFALEEAVKP